MEERRAAVRQLHQAIGSAHATPSRLANLASFLSAEEAKERTLASELAHSQAQLDRQLAQTRAELSNLLSDAQRLQREHEQVTEELIDQREALFSSTSTATAAAATTAQETLRDHLEGLARRRHELERTREWFERVSKAEQLGIVTLRFVAASRLSDAFGSYVQLVEYVAKHAELRNTLARQLVMMTRSVWTALVRKLSQTLLTALENIGWPQPFKERLDWYDAKAREFRTAFLDMLALEKLSNDHPIPEITPRKRKAPVKPLLALVPFVHPLLLRFKWHFEGTRSTNRIDKPEYPLSHVLNLIESHERFMEQDIQALLDDNGFAHIDAMTDFTTLLLPPLVNRLKFHVPQLLALPPVLAHTIYQTLEFDRMLRAREYKPRGHEGDWDGLSQVILGQKEWFDRWLLSEREFFDKRYYAAISAPDAWHVLGADEYDSALVRPTKSAQRVAELAEQLAGTELILTYFKSRKLTDVKQDRYRPLPLAYTMPFLLSLHLPLLDSYAGRITSSLAAFESLTLGSILPGGLTDGAGRAATSGLGGLQRLLRSTVSARWMAAKCAEWGEDAFFLGLLAYLGEHRVAPELVDAQRAIIDAPVDPDTVFDRQRLEFTRQADRGEELVTKHVVRETLTDLKPYLGRRFDFDVADPNDTLDLSIELNRPLALLSSLLSAIVATLPVALATTLYRRIASSLSTALYDRLLVSRTWSLDGARQFAHDLEHGFLHAMREAGIRRNVHRGWDLAVGGARILSLPTSLSSSSSSSSSATTVPQSTVTVTFAQVMQLAFDEAEPEGEGSKFREAMDALGVPESVGKAQVKALLRRRPECWR